MTLILSGTDGLSDVDGTAAAPAIRGTDANTGIFFPAADTIAFAEGGVEAMRIDSDGDVGIGTTTPNSKLTSQTASTSTSVFSFANQLNNSYASNDSISALGFHVRADVNATGVGGAIAFSGGGTSDGSGNLIFCIKPTGNIATVVAPSNEKMRIDSSGNVGIGTTATTYNYQTKNIALYDASSAGISIVGGAKILTLTAQSSGGIFVGSRSNDNLIFATNDTERMRIDTSGQLLVGITSAIIGSRTLQVKAPSGGSASAFQVANNGNAGCEFFNSSGTKVGDIAVNASSTAYNTSSDYRLKENVAPMQNALATVALLKPCTYKWKVDGSDGQGFIAHELQEVVEGCVTGEKDAVETYTDEDGNEATRPVYQGIDTSFLVATLTAAIQEQQALITALTTRITALETAADSTP